MNASLSPDIQRFVEDKIKAGQFASVDEAVNGLLSLVREQEEEELDERTLAAIRRADNEFDRGGGRPFDEVAAEFRKQRLGR